MQFMSQVAQLLAVLVEACAAQGPDHDYSSTSLPQTGHLLDRHSQDADTKGPENSHVRSWPSVSEGSVCPSMMREAWPNPTAAAWLQKSTLALKALSTLRWLNKAEQLQKLAEEPPECLPSAAQTTVATRPSRQISTVSTAAYQAVGESLLQLLHCCLAGEHTAHWAHLKQSAVNMFMTSCLSW